MGKCRLCNGETIIKEIDNRTYEICLNCRDALCLDLFSRKQMELMEK